MADQCLPAGGVSRTVRLPRWTVITLPMTGEFVIDGFTHGTFADYLTVVVQYRDENNNRKIVTQHHPDCS